MKNLRNVNTLPSVSKENKIMFRILYILLALPALTLADERTFGNGTLPEHFAFYDADNSGGLSEEELQILREDRLNRQNRLRNRWDLNNDGTISTSEREAAKTKIREAIQARRTQRFTEVDLDRNGQLTLAEFLNIPAVSDSDRSTPGIAERIFNNLDTDKNDTVSTREFLLKLDTLPVSPVDNPDPLPHPKTPQPAAPARPAR